MNTKYQIRRAAGDRDLDKIRSINVKTLSENYPKTFWKEAMTSGTPHFVAETGPTNRIVGYVATMVHDQKFMVYSIAVEPQHRKSGVGSMLMGALLEYLETYRAVADNLVLNVRVSNAVAIRLYEKHGFQRKNLVPRYYGNGEDSLEMILLRQHK